MFKRISAVALAVFLAFAPAIASAASPATFTGSVIVPSGSTVTVSGNTAVSGINGSGFVQLSPASEQSGSINTNGTMTLGSGVSGGDAGDLGIGRANGSAYLSLGNTNNDGLYWTTSAMCMTVNLGAACAMPVSEGPTTINGNVSATSGAFSGSLLTGSISPGPSSTQSEFGSIGGIAAIMVGAGGTDARVINASNSGFMPIAASQLEAESANPAVTFPNALGGSNLTEIGQNAGASINAVACSSFYISASGVNNLICGDGGGDIGIQGALWVQGITATNINASGAVAASSFNTASGYLPYSTTASGGSLGSTSHTISGVLSTTLTGCGQTTFCGLTTSSIPLSGSGAFSNGAACTATSSLPYVPIAIPGVVTSSIGLTAYNTAGGGIPGGTAVNISYTCLGN